MTVVVYYLGKRGFEAVQMCAAFLGVDVVGVGVHHLDVTVVKLHGNLDFPFRYRLVNVQRLRKNCHAVAVEVVYKLRKTAFVTKRFVALTTVAVVLQVNGNALIKVRHFAQTISETFESHSVVSKISLSGIKVIFVPVRSVSPVTTSLPSGLPR